MTIDGPAIMIQYCPNSNTKFSELGHRGLERGATPLPERVFQLRRRASFSLNALLKPLNIFIHFLLNARLAFLLSPLLNPHLNLPLKPLLKPRLSLLQFQPCRDWQTRESNRRTSYKAAVVMRPNCGVRRWKRYFYT